MNQFEELKVWQLAHKFVLDVYVILNKIPNEEKRALLDQLRRSVISIPANIVEGSERKTNKEFVQFLYVSKGSLAESRYYLILARDLKYISKTEYQNLIEQAIVISKMTMSLIKYLKSTSKT